MFRPDSVYVQVRRNAFRVRNASRNSEVSVTAEAPFSTAKLLVGKFSAAEPVLAKAIKQVAKSLLGVGPIIVIHPMEMSEGGLSEVEDRVLRDVAEGAGGSKVIVWVGKELSDEEVIAQAKSG